MGVVAFDVGTFSVGSGVNANSGTLTTTHANDLLFGYAGYWSGGTADPLYTTRGSVWVQDRVVSMTGSYAMQGMQIADNNWAFVLGAFKGQ
jgi:hypothetical protein